MTKAILIIAALLFLWGCYTNISQVVDKWGPPARVEHRNGKLVSYYYFYEDRGGALVSDTGVSWSATTGWYVVEITTDFDGNILGKRKYWKQPEIK